MVILSNFLNLRASSTRAANISFNKLSIFPLNNQNFYISVVGDLHTMLTFTKPRLLQIRFLVGFVAVAVRAIVFTFSGI